ncbi:MAG: hypothetical protein LBH64_01750, partial [Coriobacteriales bacterium]|nr:hypothetical protein [Coriobacteriales bacterium]
MLLLCVIIGLDRLANRSFERRMDGSMNVKKGILSYTLAILLVLGQTGGVAFALDPAADSSKPSLAQGEKDGPSVLDAVPGGLTGDAAGAGTGTGAGAGPGDAAAAPGGPGAPADSAPADSAPTPTPTPADPTTPEPP